MDKIVFLEKKDRETVREYAYRVLYHNIMSLQLPPGTAMSEQELSTILSVSRTPVREAFIRLAQLGLLDILPQRGTFVSKISTAQMSEFRFLRVTMEKAIMELACTHFPEPYVDQLQQCLAAQRQEIAASDATGFFASDNQMHQLLYAGCDKSHIWSIIENSNLDYMRSRVLNIASATEQMHLLFSQHQAIVEAVLRHDTVRGIAVMEEHINKVVGDIAVMKIQYPEYFQ